MKFRYKYNKEEIIKRMLEEYYDLKTKTLTLHFYFNEELKDLPVDVKIIIFGKLSTFNQKVDNLPNNLTHLTFGSTFNQIVDNLPKNLTHLTFGHYFNQSVDNLPSSLTYLTLGMYFNQKIDNLPNNLTHLTIGHCFSQSIDKLPKSIRKLGFYSCSKIRNNIPENIEKIKIIFYGDDAYNSTVKNIPSHIKEIKINAKTKIHFLKKIPFGCKIIDDNDNEIFL